MASSRLTLSQAKLRTDAGRTKFSVIPHHAYEAFLGHSIQELERKRSRRDKHILTVLRTIKGYKWNKSIVELLQELARVRSDADDLLRGRPRSAAAASVLPAGGDEDRERDHERPRPRPRPRPPPLPFGAGGCHPGCSGQLMARWAPRHHSH